MGTFADNCRTTSRVRVRQRKALSYLDLVLRVTSVEMKIIKFVSTRHFILLYATNLHFPT